MGVGAYVGSSHARKASTARLTSSARESPSSSERSFKRSICRFVRYKLVLFMWQTFGDKTHSLSQTEPAKRKEDGQKPRMLMKLFHCTWLPQLRRSVEHAYLQMSVHVVFLLTIQRLLWYNQYTRKHTGGQEGCSSTSTSWMATSSNTRLSTKRSA